MFIIFGTRSACAVFSDSKQAKNHQGGSPATAPHGFGPLDQRCHSLQYKSLTCVPALLRLSALSSGLLRNFLCCCWVSHWVTTGLTSHQVDLSGHSRLSLSFPVCEHLVLHTVGTRDKNVAKIFVKALIACKSILVPVGMALSVILIRL